MPDFVDGEDDGETAERERARIRRDLAVVAETKDDEKNCNDRLMEELDVLLESTHLCD